MPLGSTVSLPLLSSGPAFLSSAEGSAYLPAFACLRLPFMMTHRRDLDVLLEDRVFPAEDILRASAGNWYRTLAAFRDTSSADG